MMSPSLQPYAAFTPGNCLNCHQPLSGAFCTHCGQPAATPARITLKGILAEIPNILLDWDRSLPYTLREMVLRPGPTLLRYLRGERARFFRPLSLLLLLAGINSFFFLTLDIVPYNADDPNIPAESRAIQREFTQFMSDYQSWVQLLLLPLNAAVAYWLLRRRTGLNYAEQLTVNTLVTASYTAVLLLAIPVLWYTSSKPAALVVAIGLTLVMLFMKARGYAHLQRLTLGRSRRGNWAWAVLTTLLEYTLSLALMSAVMTMLMLRHQ